MAEPIYLRLKDILESKKYPIPRSTLYHLFQEGKKNGLSKYAVKIGNRWMIREDHFEKWVESNVMGARDE
jgi:hypothetical protein